MLPWRVAFAMLLLACAGMIGFALYHQYYNWIMPCLLCVYERVAVILTGFFALLCVMLRPAGRKGTFFLAALVSIPALAGLGTAIRHALLQYGPREFVVNCASSLPFPIDLGKLPGWLASVIRPVGDCSAVDFTLFGISLPVWLIVAFTAILGWVWLTARQRLAEISRRRWL